MSLDVDKSNTIPAAAKKSRESTLLNLNQELTKTNKKETASDIFQKYDNSLAMAEGKAVSSSASFAIGIGVAAVQAKGPTNDEINKLIDKLKEPKVNWSERKKILETLTSISSSVSDEQKKQIGNKLSELILNALEQQKKGDDFKDDPEVRHRKGSLITILENMTFPIPDDVKEKIGDKLIEVMFKTPLKNHADSDEIKKIFNNFSCQKMTKHIDELTSALEDNDKQKRMVAANVLQSISKYLKEDEREKIFKKLSTSPDYGRYHAIAIAISGLADNASKDFQNKVVAKFKSDLDHKYIEVKLFSVVGLCELSKIKIQEPQLLGESLIKAYDTTKSLYKTVPAETVWRETVFSYLNDLAGGKEKNDYGAMGKILEMLNSDRSISIGDVLKKIIDSFSKSGLKAELLKRVQEYKQTFNDKNLRMELVHPKEERSNKLKKFIGES